MAPSTLMTVRFAPALVAAGLLLTGCSHSSSVPQPVARTNSASVPGPPAASLSPSFATATPPSRAHQAFVSSVEPLLSRYSSDNQIKIGKLICETLAVQDSYVDAQHATQTFGLSPSEDTDLIHASIGAYCPRRCRPSPPQQPLQHRSQAIRQRQAPSIMYRPPQSWRDVQDHLEQFDRADHLHRQRIDRAGHRRNAALDEEGGPWQLRVRQRAR